MVYVENYRKRFGSYPKEILADQIYCNKANRIALKEKGIQLIGKPLGRLSAVKNVCPGELNPIEGKFGQAKTGYGLNCIKARLSSTSESWIACIILVLNLVKLAGASLPCLYFKQLNSFLAKKTDGDTKAPRNCIFNKKYFSCTIIRFSYDLPENCCLSFSADLKSKWKLLIAISDFI